MSDTRILYYDLETKDIIKIIREVDSNLNDPYFEVSYDDIKDFIEGTKVQSQYYIELNPKDPNDFNIKKKEIHLNIREIDKTLHKIKLGNEDDLSYDIRIVHNKQDKTISFEFNPTLKAYMDWYYISANLASKNSFYAATHHDEFGVSNAINTGISSYTDTEHSDIWRVARYAKRIPYSGTITKVMTHVESTGASADSDIEVGVWIASISGLSLDTQLATTTNKNKNETH